MPKHFTECLNCHLISKDNKNHRASQLKNILMNGSKILVISDDVWKGKFFRILLEFHLMKVVFPRVVRSS